MTVIELDHLCRANTIAIVRVTTTTTTTVIPTEITTTAQAVSMTADVNGTEIETDVIATTPENIITKRTVSTVRVMAHGTPVIETLVFLVETLEAPLAAAAAALVLLV